MALNKGIGDIDSNALLQLGQDVGELLDDVSIFYIKYNNTGVVR